jgi:hypothetical protein
LRQVLDDEFLFGVLLVADSAHVVQLAEAAHYAAPIPHFSPHIHDLVEGDVWIDAAFLRQEARLLVALNQMDVIDQVDGMPPPLLFIPRCGIEEPQ